MSQPIKELTAEQRTRLVEIRDRYMAYSLSCEPMDRAAAEEGVFKAYKAADFKAPQRVEFFDSPKAMLLECARQCLGVSGGAEAEAALATMVRDENAQRCTTGDPRKVKERARHLAANYVYGRYEAPWLAYYQFYREVCGMLEETEPIQGLDLLARSAGWCVFCDEAAFVSNRPEEIHRDEQGSLHNGQGMAVKYRDGWGFYAWKGIRVPEQAILAPETLTWQQVQAEANAEVARSLVERMGAEKYLRESGAKVVHMDMTGRTQFGNGRALYRASDGSQWLEGSDGSTGRPFFMPVPPEEETCEEAHSAIAGFDTSDILMQS